MKLIQRPKQLDRIFFGHRSRFDRPGMLWGMRGVGSISEKMVQNNDVKAAKMGGCAGFVPAGNFEAHAKAQRAQRLMTL